MIRKIADFLYGAGIAHRTVSKAHPDEVVSMSTAATILEGPPGKPIGWSWRRFFQRRGHVVITNRRIFVQSGFASPMMAIWGAVLAFAIYQLTTIGGWTWIAWTILATVYLLQFRPYRQDLPYDKAGRIQFGHVRGILGEADTISVGMGKRGIHLVSAQRLPETLKLRMRGPI